MFGWDFRKCKMHFRQNAFYKFSFLEQKSESKIFWILILASTFNFYYSKWDPLTTVYY